MLDERVCHVSKVTLEMKEAFMKIVMLLIVVTALELLITVGVFWNDLQRRQDLCNQIHKSLPVAQRHPSEWNCLVMGQLYRETGGYDQAILWFSNVEGWRREAEIGITMIEADMPNALRHINNARKMNAAETELLLDHHFLKSPLSTLPNVLSEVTNEG
jgi:hypothetical protein